MKRKETFEVQHRILEAYEEELRKHRREGQVQRILQNEKGLQEYALKCANNLVRWHLEYDVRRFVACQFFALNYMPYLPKMMHVASDKGKERFEKYKSFFEKLISKRKKEAYRKRLHRKVEVNRVLLRVITGLQKYEEEDKARFHNTVEGFLFCLESTTLFHPMSKWCKNCKFKKICSCKLRSQFPLMYRYRKGYINKQTLMNKLSRSEMEILL
jgi:hypothetical protein